MTKVDQFESVFKAAAKPVYQHACPKIDRVLVLCDLEGEPAKAFLARVRAFLRVIDERAAKGVTWELLEGPQTDSVAELLTLVNRTQADLIVTYRNLHSAAWRYTFTLGRHLDVLAQETPVPILVVPNPRAEGDEQAFPGGAPGWDRRTTETVMALTDHLSGDDALVNVAAHLVADAGTLVFAHVEDDVVFERYMEAIGKIAEIDTDAAREMILSRLLQDPADYIASCKRGLEAGGHAISVRDVVTVGHRVGEVRRIIEAQDVDLVVLNTKDDDQYAMHGLAYPLVIELRGQPMLLI